MISLPVGVSGHAGTGDNATGHSLSLLLISVAFFANRLLVLYAVLLILFVVLFFCLHVSVSLAFHPSVTLKKEKKNKEKLCFKGQEWSDANFFPFQSMFSLLKLSTLN